MIQRCLHSRYALAAMAGLLLAAAFPKPGLASLAWIAPGLILFAAIGTSGGQAFRIGYVAGLAHYLASLHWLLFIPFPAGAVLGWFSLSAYLALYPATWVWLGWKMLFPPGRANAAITTSAGTLSGNPSDPARNAFLPSLAGFALRRWHQRFLWYLFCASLWVALELLIGWFLSGFPWNLLGASQYAILPIIQIASFTGVYGVSFLVVWFSVTLAGTAAMVARRTLESPNLARLHSDPFAQAPALSLSPWPSPCGWVWMVELLPVLMVLTGVILFGLRQLGRSATAGRELSVALVQPSIPQTLIWDARENTNRFNKLVELSRQALATKPDVLVWPEAGVPDLLRYETNYFQAVTNLARQHHVWIILGADDAEPRLGSPTETDYFNAAFLVSPEGQLRNRYCKQKLVIFGEYVPLARWLPFLKWVTPIEGGFTPGREPVAFKITRPAAKLGMLICFEDVFPSCARASADDDTDVLLNLTNNGWFSASSAQWQHAASAVFRAVENGLPLVRCANNGLTCWVDACGRMREVFFPQTSDIYGAGFKTARIPLLAEGGKRRPTFYHRHGNWFAWGCLLYCGVGIVIKTAGDLRAKRRPSPSGARA